MGSRWSTSSAHIDRATLNQKLEGILEIYEKFVGDDPREVPMKIFPGMHYTMGGLWVDFDQMTNIPGIFAAGECEYQYHGANRLGANSLVSCIYRRISRRTECRSVREEPGGRGRRRRPRRRTGPPGGNQRQADQQPGYRESHSGCGANWGNHDRARHRHPLQQGLKKADEKIVELLDRYRNVNLSDRSQWANTSFAFARQLNNMLELSRAVAQGALLRDESRGAHYKPDFPTATTRSS